MINLSKETDADEGTKGDVIAEQVFCSRCFNMSQ